MKKTLLTSSFILFIVSFLAAEASLQDTKQATLDENGKIVLEEVSLKTYKYSVDVTSLNLDTTEEVSTYFSEINQSQYFRVEVVSSSEINLILIRNNVYRNALWDVAEWNELLSTL